MDFNKLEECLNELVNVYKTPGVDCIVYKDHELLYRYYTGYSDIENNKKINGNELYLIFSMSKMLTCTGALQLLEQGKFSLDDKLSDYLPEFEKMRIASSVVNNADAAAIASGSVSGEKSITESDLYAKNPITIRDLFTMSAGLNYDLAAPEIKKYISEGKTSTREIVRALSKTVLAFEPGTDFRYSLCHDVLGGLIEVISGMKFGEYMKKNVFDVLGMENTFFGIPKDEERLSRMAVKYTYDKTRQVVTRCPLECEYIITDEYESGGAGLVSCPVDYALFLDALACGGIGKNGNRILSESTVDLMRTNQLDEKRIKRFYEMRRFGYGYGLGVRTHMNKTESRSMSPIGEFGWDGAAGSFAMVDKDNKISLTYFQEILAWDIEIQTKLKNALYSCFENN